MRAVAENGDELDVIMETKICSKCGRELPLSEFYKSKGYKYGIGSRCKKCTVEYHRKYRIENKERIAERDRKYRAENKGKIAERDRKYYAANKEKIAERKRKYRAENKEKIAEYRRKYYAENKEKIAERDRRYRAANKEKIAERDRKYQKELYAHYIIARLRDQHIPINETTIELQRNRLLLKRYIREQTKNA